MIQVDLTHMRRFIALPYEAALAPRLRIAHNHLQKSDGAGGDFTGWVRLPQEYDRQEFDRIQAAARRIQSDSRALVVIGIGGSYLGARGVIECLCSPNYNLRRKDTPNIYFVGNGLSDRQLRETMELLEGEDFSVNVISKSGTTTEPAVAFRFFRELLEKKYGPDGAARRIYATTDRQKGALKSLADQAGYETFVVPDAVGGRYSVLTAVGLLPIAAAGIDIAALMEGAACESIAPYLAEGETSVGVSLQLFHTAATPVGMEVRAESVVTAVDGKKITFTVTAYDEAGEIGHAQHERVIVKAERFLEKTYDKL